MAATLKTQTVEDFSWDTPLEEDSAPKGQPPVSSQGPAPTEDRTKEGPRPSLDLLLDVPLEITAELGRTRMIINDLLQLGQGSVIELNKLAGEPLEILVNQKLIARGEVVVVNEKFGIRLTDIISPMERIKQLG